MAPSLRCPPHPGPCRFCEYSAGSNQNKGKLTVGRMGAPEHPFGWSLNRRLPYFRVGVNGSSLPHCSGLPVARNLSWRAFDRWTASSIMSGVAVVRGALTLAVDVAVVLEVDVIASCAKAGKPGMAQAAAKSVLTATTRFNGMCTCLILSSVGVLLTSNHTKFADQVEVLGSPSGRISGVVKKTPSGVGLGVGVTAVCGPTADSRLCRIRSAKSSCTVLWQCWT